MVAEDLSEWVMGVPRKEVVGKSPEPVRGVNNYSALEMRHAVSDKAGVGGGVLVHLGCYGKSP